MDSNLIVNHRHFCGLVFSLALVYSVRDANIDVNTLIEENSAVKTKKAPENFSDADTEKAITLTNI